MSVISGIVYQQKKKNWEIAVSLKMLLPWHHSSSAVVIWEKHSNAFSRDSQLRPRVFCCCLGGAEICRVHQTQNMTFSCSCQMQTSLSQAGGELCRPAQKCVSPAWAGFHCVCAECFPWEPTARLVGTGPFSILNLTWLQWWQGIKQCQGLGRHSQFSLLAWFWLQLKPFISCSAVSRGTKDHLSARERTPLAGQL